jgi:hypothetical protein
MPKAYAYARSMLATLFDWNTSLKLNFPKNSTYPTVALNFGPQSVCDDHEDSLNFFAYLCAITAVGRFKHKKGGQLILRQLKLYADFPSGSTILIPSASVTHANIPIQPRYSVTQYLPAGLICWVFYSFCSLSSLKTPAGRAKKDVIDQEFQQDHGSMWEWMLGLFSKADELGFGDKEANVGQRTSRIQNTSSNSHYRPHHRIPGHL